MTAAWVQTENPCNATAAEAGFAFHKPLTVSALDSCVTALSPLGCRALATRGPTSRADRVSLSPCTAVCARAGTHHKCGGTAAAAFLSLRTAMGLF